MLIFGSTAAKHWYPDFREPKDLDRISKDKYMSPDIQHYWQKGFKYVVDFNVDPTYVDPDFLYTIKVSHAAWDIHWDKTMHDIMFLRRKHCRLDVILYNLLYAEWEVEHRAKRVNLNKKNDEFFNENVTRKWDHDWLHTVMAFGSEPLHNRIRLDPDKALCNEKLWTALSYDDKIRCAMEEIYVIAAERFITHGYPPRMAKIKSLKNLITSMSKGWFNLFLIENFEALLNFDDTHFLTKLKEINK